MLDVLTAENQELRSNGDLLNEYKDNPVVLEIIKARVISYVYNNYVDFNTRQKIGQLCKLRLVDNTGINQKKLYNRD